MSVGARLWRQGGRPGASWTHQGGCGLLFHQDPQWRQGADPLWTEPGLVSSGRVLPVCCVPAPCRAGWRRPRERRTLK